MKRKQVRHITHSWHKVRKWHFFFGYVLFIIAACQSPVPDKIQAASAGIPDKIDYSLHVKPILSDRCFACHGPDNNTREAGLRLDTEEGAYAALQSNEKRFALKAGNLKKSEVFHRIIASDPDLMMPPPESNLSLTDKEKAIIVRWIEQGAEYKPHWAFVKPERPKLPKVKNKQWPQNEIDYFVLKKLEKQGLEPNSKANKTTLIRRLYFDLTGLPPTPVQVDGFINNTSADAYEKLVDDLLQSPAHAERMAMEWMDVARYADSHGFHADGLRHMWPWRDWVISAFAKNLSYDKFITWQTAGDLLPNATREQIIATGFNRNHPINSEAGVVPEEFRVEAVLDRANTTAKAFLALTFECARCHDHKFDPISQKEYFQFSAFFNNVDELGVISNDGNTGPLLKLTNEVAENKLDSIHQLVNEIAARQEAIKQKNSKITHLQPNLKKGLLAHLPLDATEEKATNLAKRRKPGKLRGEVELVAGANNSAVKIDSDYEFLQIEEGMFEKTQPFSVSLWLKPEKQDHYQEIFGNAGQKNSFWRGYEAYLDSLNRISFRLTHALPHNLVHVTSKQPIPLNEWTHLAFSYDGSAKAMGVKIYINGKVAESTIHYDNLYKSILPVNAHHNLQKRDIRFGKAYRGNTGDDGLLKGAFDEVRVYERKISALEVAHIYQEVLPQKAISWLSREDSMEHYLMQQPDYLASLAQLQKMREAELNIVDTITEVMVMKEMPEMRSTYVLDRGVYNAHLEQVFPGTPSSINQFAEAYESNRLGLAQWLVAEDNPLTARVAVNRYWQMLFGRGIVATSNDFGNQGDLPTHPELLDWLAVDFRENGWNVRRLLKQMVMSATYQQSSVASPEKQEKDPDNLWLAYGPKHRLQAEMIRDNALQAAGLLVKNVGGPSVKPFQPKGLWSEKASFSRKLHYYTQDSGKALYRRSMYTFIRRSQPPPNLAVFDQPNRNYCVIKRQTTNTPLQSLVLLNDPQFIEASRLVAERMQHQAGGNVEQQLNYGFRLLTSRKLKPKETEIFKKLYQEEINKFSQQEKAADSLLSIGDYPRDPSLDKVYTAALTVVASLMMNHDEAYMKR